MPSRATSIDGMDWRTWFLHDYARYWYGFGVFLVVVFGVGELMRVVSPLDTAEVVGLFFLLVLLVGLGLLGYALIWRRDGPLAIAFLGQWRRFRMALRKLWLSRPSPAQNDEDTHEDDPSDPEAHHPRDPVA